MSAAQKPVEVGALVEVLKFATRNDPTAGLRLYVQDRYQDEHGTMINTLTHDYSLIGRKIVGVRPPPKSDAVTMYKHGIEQGSCLDGYPDFILEVRQSAERVTARHNRAGESS